MTAPLSPDDIARMFPEPMSPERLKYLRDNLGEWDMDDAVECLDEIERLRAIVGEGK